MSINAPVLLIFFNREKEVLQVIEAIKKSAPKKVYIASDGGRTDKEHEKICRLRKTVQKYIDWECQLKCLFSDTNLGCQMGPVTAINWVFEQEDRCIILEDDCVPNVTFFKYCDQLLERYAQNENIWMISGENYLHEVSMFEGMDYTFSLRTDTWGWATWKRAWQKCDFSLKRWPDYKREKALSHTYYMQVYDELEYMIRQLDNIYKQKDKSIWDYQWRFQMVVNNGLCIIPSKNLINNIGWGKYATHTKTRDKIWDVPVEELNFPLKHPTCIAANVDFDKEYGNLLFMNKLKYQVKKRNIYGAAKMLFKHYIK